MKSFAFEGQRVLMGRLARGDDLAEGLAAFCEVEGVRAGSLTGIGALEQGVLGFYDQAAGRYESVTLGGGQEIASLVGNISMKDGVPFVHAHLVLADDQLACRGGHLMPGCTVFACEFTVWAFDGTPPERLPDEATGLALW